MAIDEISNIRPKITTQITPSKAKDGSKAFVSNGFAVMKTEYGSAGVSGRMNWMSNIVKRRPKFSQVEVTPILTIYGDMLVSPDYVDLGIVSESQAFAVTISTSYNYRRLMNRLTITGDMDAVTISDFDEVNGDGIYFEAGESRNFVVSIDANSDSTKISGYIKFYLSNGEQATVRVIGTINKTSGVFNEDTKAISGVTCSLEYNVKRLNAINGKEYSVLTDKSPRESTNQKVIQKPSKIYDWVNTADLSGSIAMANYFYAIYWCKAIASGTQQLEGDFVGFSINQNGTLLIKEGDVFETVIVENASEGVLFFKYPIKNNYIKPIITPVHNVTIKKIDTVEYIDLYQLNVSAKREYFFNTPQKSDLPETVQVINGKYVFPLPYTFHQVSKSIESGVKIRDYDRGVWDTYGGYGKKEKSYSIEMGFIGLPEYQKMVDFYQLVNGVFNEFYIPSLHDEIAYSVEGDTITDHIEVLYNKHIADFNDHAAVFFKIGEKVISVEIDYYDYDNTTGNTSIYFKESVNLSVDEICYCGWVVLCRFDSALSSTREPYVIKTSVDILEWY